MVALADNVLAFGRLLRRLGVDVSAARSRDALAAVAAVGLARRDDVRHALCAAMVSRAADLPLFDRLFDAFWRDHGDADGARAAAAATRSERMAAAAEVVRSERDAAPAGDPDDAGEGDAGPEVVRTWSAHEALRDLDFAAVTAAELAAIRAAVEALVWHPGERVTRRWAPGAGGRVDLRRAWRERVRRGELLRLPTRSRITRPRPLVLLADVSGSMERYSRMLLHFAYALRRAHGRVEVFLFATTLTRVTRELAAGSVDAAVAAVSRRVRDWSGGTRIGEALRDFHVRWARSVLSRRPVVLVVSDGWDRGEPRALQGEVARLQRSSHRLIWLSPLLGTPGYEPLTRGLRAALPYVDDFLPVRTLRNLEDLAAHLNQLPGGRPGRRQGPGPSDASAAGGTNSR